MPLTLVLGPANSAKAGELLGAYAAAAQRGALLVVPTAVDADHYGRELAGEGAVLGSVTTFSGLAAEIARRAGYAAKRLSRLQRERLLRRAVARASLPALEQSAASRGFPAAVGELISELERSLVSSERFGGALARWSAGDPRREPYARDIATLYREYVRELQRTGRVDRDLFAWRALDALRAAPTRVGRRPRLLLWLRRPDAARARRRRDAVPGRRRRGRRVADLRARAGDVRRARRGGRGFAPAREPRARAPGTRRALPARGSRRAASPRAVPVRAAARAPRPGGCGPPARGRRRARRGRARRRRGAGRAAGRHPRRGDRRDRALVVADRARARARLGAVRDRGREPAAAAVCSHRARARRARARPLRVARRCPGRRAARISAHAGAARASRGRRSSRVRASSRCAQDRRSRA